MPEADSRGRRGAAPVKVRPFQIRGRFLTAVALRMDSYPVDDAFYQALDEQLDKTPQLLAEAPMVLDFETADQLVKIDEIREVVQHLRKRKLLGPSAASAT